MALEDAINNLALAIREHASVLAQTIGAPAPVEAPKETKKTTQEAQKSAKATIVEAPVEESTSAVATEEITKAPTTVEEVVDYKVLQAKFQELVTKDMDLAKSVLTQLGFPRLSLVPANLHANALALTEKALVNG